MDWENERYVRVYTRDTGDILAIGWQGRTVLWELMRKVDRAGVLDESDNSIVAELLRLPLDVTEQGIGKLLNRKVIERTSMGILIPNFISAQEAKMSDKQRQAESRARRREQARSGKEVDTVNDGKPKPIDNLKFEEAYKYYPRKQGKAAGLKKVPSLIKTEEDLEKFKQCIWAMHKAWKDYETSKCPHFSTFVNKKRWLDEEWPMPSSDTPLKDGKSRKSKDFPLDGSEQYSEGNKV